MWGSVFFVAPLMVENRIAWLVQSLSVMRMKTYGCRNQ